MNNKGITNFYTIVWLILNLKLDCLTICKMTFITSGCYQG